METKPLQGPRLRRYEVGSVGARRLELCAKPVESPVEGNLNCVSAQAEPFSDLSRGQVCAVAKRDQLTIAGAQLRDRGVQGEASDRPLLEIVFVGCLRNVAGRFRSRRQGSIDAASGDAEQPCDWLTLRAVVALAVAKCAGERLTGYVLGGLRVAEAIRSVRVDTPDQWLWLRERVGTSSHPLRIVGPFGEKVESSGALSPYGDLAK
jgi:hypothetical protein